MTQIFNTISRLLNYVIPSDTEFPLGRFLPADPTAGDILQVRLPALSTGPHCLRQKPQAEDLVEPPLQRADRLPLC